MQSAATTSPLPVPPLLRRGLARGIDLGVQIALMEAAFQCSSLLPDALLRLDEGTLFAVDMAVGLTALVLYAGTAERLSGATLGKLCVGLRVIGAGGGPVDLRSAVLRNIVFLIDSLFFGLVAYSAISRSVRGQRLGDVWADTIVVYRADAPGAARQSAWLGWLVGAGLAFAFVLGSYLFAS